MSSRLLLLLCSTLLVLIGSVKLNSASRTVHLLMNKEQHHAPFSPMLNLGHNVFDQLQLYECSRQGGDCASYQALSALLALGRRGKDCEAEKEFPMCQIALRRITEALGETVGEVVDVDSLYPLVLGKIKEDIPYIRGVFTELEKFICHKEGEDSEKCAEFRGIHLMYEHLNSAAEEGRL